MGLTVGLQGHLHRLHLLERSLQPFWGVDGCDPAVIDDGYAITELVCFLDLVGCQKDRGAVGVHLTDQIPDGPGALDVQPWCWLV